MTMDDMRNYRVSWPQPLVARYSGADVHTVGLPAYGGAHVHQALNLMDLMDVRAYGHYAGSPEALFRLIQACTALRTRSFWAMESVEVPGVDLTLAARATRASAVALWEAARQGRIPDALVPPVTPAGGAGGRQSGWSSDHHQRSAHACRSSADLRQFGRRRSSGSTGAGAPAATVPAIASLWRHQAVQHPADARAGSAVQGRWRGIPGSGVLPDSGYRNHQQPQHRIGGPTEGRAVSGGGIVQRLNDTKHFI